MQNLYHAGVVSCRSCIMQKLYHAGDVSYRSCIMQELYNGLAGKISSGGDRGQISRQDMVDNI